jgi:predicted esterase
VSRALLVAFCAIALGGATTSDLHAAIVQAQGRLEHLVPSYAAKGPVLAALQLGYRLRYDAAFVDTRRPPDVPEADWQATLRDNVQLDADLVDQLARGPSLPALEPGLHDHVVASKIDGVFDAVAMYVPRVPPHAVVIFLHGSGQTESELLSAAYSQRLADRTGTILVAPFGRGEFDFAGNATADLYALLRTLAQMPALETLPFYLAGYSMGGFTAYLVGPEAPIAWRGVLDIAGALPDGASGGVLQHWRNTRIYIVHGERDATVPVRFARDTAMYLFRSALPVSYYEQRGAGHSLRKLMPSVDRAFHDMLAGVVSNSEAVQLSGRETQRFGAPATLAPMRPEMP